MLNTKMTVLLSCMTLAGCSSSTYNSATDQNKDTLQRTEKLTKMAERPMPKADTSVVPVRSGVYLGATSMKRQSGQVLPASVERDGIRLATPDAQSLMAIGDLIFETTGIPVSFSSDIYAVKNVPVAAPTAPTTATSTEAGAIAAALDAALPKAINAPQDAQVPTVFAGKVPNISRDKMRVNYNGSLSGFLNTTAAYYDIGWSYHDGRIQFSRNITRTFKLASMPTVLDSSASMTGGLTGKESDKGSSMNAGSTQTSSIKVQLDFWKELEANLKNSIGDNGTFTVSPTNTSITVTAPASVVDRVGRQIQEANKQLLRQVAIKVDVYRFNVARDSNWQFDLTAQFKTGVAKYGLGSTALMPDGQNLVGSVTASVTGGRFEGSKAVLDMLEENGDVSVVTTANVTTMSGQPVPVQVSNSRGYVSAIKVEMNDNKTTTTAESSMVTAGFSMNILPNVMDDGKVLMQYNMNISTLVGKDNGFETVVIDNNGTKMQLPNVDQRSFIQSGMVNNGSTLVMAGFEQVLNNTSDRGQGSANFKLLGGKRAGQQSREILVICITPVVLDHTAELASLN
ncbi:MULTISPECIES: hypothetical protein [Yersinia]|uniref:PilN family type IV pilus biogenesis protein n=1 Tax=Yersinia intermedia TaxID=631 RepID=A0A0H5LZL5_YERIN|nr:MULTISPECIES: hypothetical protein [Yersinia]MCB5309625.1 hypothetical protein [Yersinia massiliensis]CRY56505.1 PilN family type IV pilus biogenesis protein [Yersinia intermedia]